MRLAGLLLIGVAGVAGAAPPRSPRPVPVPVGGDRMEDACGATGSVSGLAGGGPVAVRSGPGARFRTIGRLGGGRQVRLCAERPGWYGIVYDRAGGDGARCGVGTPRAAGRYAGPCRSGWVGARYVRLEAG